MDATCPNCGCVFAVGDVVTTDSALASGVLSADTLSVATEAPAVGVLSARASTDDATLVEIQWVRNGEPLVTVVEAMTLLVAAREKGKETWDADDALDLVSAL